MTPRADNGDPLAGERRSRRSHWPERLRAGPSLPWFVAPPLADGIKGRMPILPYLDASPVVGRGVAMAEDAFLVGKVTLDGPAVLKSNAVLRGDQNQISVGPRFHIGRGSTIHVETHTDTQIGADV